MEVIDSIEKISVNLTPDVMAIIILSFLVYLIAKNTSFDQSLKRQFVKIAILVLFLAVLEVVEYYLGSIIHPIPHFIMESLGLVVCATIPMYMAFLFDESLTYRKRFLLFPIYILITLSILSFFIWPVFHFTPESLYENRMLHFSTFVITIYSFGIFIHTIYKKVQNYDREEKSYLYSLSILIIFAVTIKAIYPSTLLVWNAVAISILLYYVFLKELQAKYDPLTNVRNRRSFDAKMVDLQNQEAITIIVFDLNNLKLVNDLYGHLQGDIYIRKSAALINQTFRKIGTTYRVGGDEFCVLCETNNEDQMNACLEKLLNLVRKQKKIGNVKFQIAYGYSIYESVNNKTIYECLEEADKNMYRNKTFSKKHG